MNRKLWPNILSGLRIALTPAVLTAAMAGSKPWFLVLLAASLTTDALDGFLARRWNAFSEFGRKLDSAADYIVMIVGLSGIAMLWPDIVHRELPWIVAGLGAFFAAMVYGLVRLGRPLCYHTWGAKIGTMACALSMIPLLAEWTALPFHVVISFQVLVGVEEMLIAFLIPSHVGEVPTLWHAVQLRRESMALLLQPIRRPRPPVRRSSSAGRGAPE